MGISKSHLLNTNIKYLNGYTKRRITKCKHLYRDHEITLEILEFILNWIEKVKPVFLFSSNVYIS